MTDRPTCRRCKGPLDIWRDPETGIGFECNNPEPIQSNEQFWERYASLSGDDVARLEKSLYPRSATS